MADFESNFRYDSDFSKVTEDIKKLVREATNANSVFAQLNKTAASVKMEAARSFSAQAGFAGFKAQIVDLTGATENFGQQLMKNKLTMREYFKEAAQAYKKDSKARALAEREVRRAQSTVVGMGDVGGRRKGVLLTPQALDMSKTTTKLQIASKQYEIFNDLVQKGSTAMVNWGKNTQWAGRQLTVGLTVPMSIFAGQAMKAFAEVDAEITRFRKVYGSDLTGTVGDATDEMVSTIRNMGAEFAKQYGIASSQTMALAADLAAAGLEGEKLANAVNQTTRMMVLGEVDRQEAMKATLSIQTAFNQSSRQLAESIDFLNAVENSTSASLQDLVEAIPKTGPVIQSLGGDIKDLSVLMTAMREGGINAAEGANALKSGMASLISPTNKAIEVARQFGIDLEGIVKRNKGQLMPTLTAFQESLQGLDDFGKAKLIEEIFGKYQFARMSALFDNLNAQGSQTVGMMKLMKMSADELAKKSYSELQAQQNAPSTRLAAMQQQLTEQLIKVGADIAETLLPIMQGALDIMSKIVDGFNNLPGPIKSFAKILAGVAAASGPILMLAGVFGNLIGNAIKFGMSIVNMFKRMTGHPVAQLQILSDEELAAKVAADQLTGAYERQRTSVAELNAALDMYIANLREAAMIAPPGAVTPGKGGRGPMPPIRRAEGGVIYAQNGVDSGGRINGYGGGDTVPALLEPGEFVINKQSSAKYSGLLRDINSGKNVPGYAKGTPGGVGDVYEEKAAITDKFKSLKADMTIASKSYQQALSAGILTPEERAAYERVIPNEERVRATATRYGITFPEGFVADATGMDRAHWTDVKNVLEYDGKAKAGKEVSVGKGMPGFQTGERAWVLGNEYLLSTTSEAGPLNKLVENLHQTDGAAKNIATILNEHIGSNTYSEATVKSILADTRPLAANSQLNQLVDDISKAMLKGNPALKGRLFNVLTNGGNPMQVAKLVGALTAWEGTGSVGPNKRTLLTAQAKVSAYQTMPELFAEAESRTQTIKAVDEVVKILEGPIDDKAVARVTELASGLNKKQLISGRQLSALKAAVFNSRELGVLKPEEVKLIEQIPQAEREAVLKSLGLNPKRRLSWSATQKTMEGRNAEYRSASPEFKVPLRGRIIYVRGRPVAIGARTGGQIPELPLGTFTKGGAALQHFAFGGPVGKWNMPFKPNDPSMAAIKDWTGGNMGQFRNTAMHPIVVGRKSGYSGKTVGYRRGLNPKFNKDKLYSLLKTLGIVPEGLVIRRASTLNPGVSTEFADAQQLKLMQAIRTGKFDEIFGMELNQRGLSSYSSLDPRTGAEGVLGINRFHMREEPNSMRGSLQPGTGKIERGIGGRLAGPQGYEQVYFQHTTSGVERGRDITANKVYGGEPMLDELLTYKMNSIIDAVSTDLKTRKIIFHTKGVQKRKTGGVIFAQNGTDSRGRLNGYGGGDTVPAMLEPGEFVINKQSSQKYSGLLTAINRDTLPGFKTAGQVGPDGQPVPGTNNKGPSRIQAAGGGMNVAMGIGFAAMSLASMPAIIDDIKESGLNFTNAMTLAFNALGIAMGASTIKNLMGFGKVAGEAGKGIGMLSRLTGPLVTAFGAAVSAIGVVGVGAILAGVAAIGVGIFLWRKNVQKNADQVANLFGEASEMAKVYNIELRKTNQALKENRKQLMSVGIAYSNGARGQTEKDYAKAIQKDFGSANGKEGNVIQRIQEENSALAKRNDLALTYTKLILQGYSKEQAREITAEIARQAGATGEYNAILGELINNIKDEEDALAYMVEQYKRLNPEIATAEEKTQAFIGVWSNLSRMINESPAAAADAMNDAVDALLSTTDDIDTATTSINENLLQMGYGTDSVYTQLIDGIIGKFGSLEDLMNNPDSVGALKTYMLSAQLQIPEATVTKLNVQELNMVNAEALMAIEAKNAINALADTRIKAANEAIKGTNDYYDNLIAKEEAAKDKVQKNHDKKMEQLQDEADRLNDLKDIIGDNADYYIKMLEKEYSAEQYYQKQREMGINGLKALAEGNIFGYIDSQMQQASEAQQFGREQAIAQIEDTRDAALAALDAQLKANEKAQGSLDDNTNAQLQGIEDRITALNMERSAVIKQLNAYIDGWQKIKETPIGEITAGKLKELETQAANLKDKLPANITKAFSKGADQILEGVGKSVKTAINKIETDLGLPKGSGAKLFQTFLGWQNPNAGQTGEFNTETNGATGGDSSTPEVNMFDPQGRYYQPKGKNAYVKKSVGRGRFQILKWNYEQQKYMPVLGSDNKTPITVSATQTTYDGYKLSSIKEGDESTAAIVNRNQSNKAVTDAPMDAYKDNWRIGWYTSSKTGKSYTIVWDNDTKKKVMMAKKWQQFIVSGKKKYYARNITAPGNQWIPEQITQNLNSGGSVLRLNNGSRRVVPGLGNTDTVPAMLTPGEFVVNKAATAANLPLLQAINSGATIPGFKNGGMPGFSAPSYSMPSISAPSVMISPTSTSEVVSNNTSNNVTMPVNIVINGNNLSEDAIIGVMNRELNRQRRAIERSISI